MPQGGFLKPPARLVVMPLFPVFYGPVSKNGRLFFPAEFLLSLFRYL